MKETSYNLIRGLRLSKLDPSSLRCRCLNIPIALLAFLAILFFSMTGCGCFVAPRGQTINVNAKAPEFSLVDQHGETVSLQGMLDKGPLVLVFYRGHW